MAYTQRQIMLCFAYLAYTDDQLTTGTPTLDAQIAADLTAQLQSNASNPLPPIAGQWSLVWGPATYTVPGSAHQDNMMYVVQLNGTGGDQPQYAIAIRGTNGSVPLDWLLEDLDIFTTMPWPPGSSSPTGNVTESASIGLQILLSMQDPNSGQTLIQFLTSAMQSVTTPYASVCVTGHSLGGALSSVLAFYLRTTQSTWDPNGASIVTTITFAGPSAGDDGFASAFDSAFQYSGNPGLSFWTPADSSSPSYADIVRTSLDIAPLAWNTTTMGTITKIYTGHFLDSIEPPPGTSIVIGYITDIIGKYNYTQVSASQASLPGTFVKKSDLPPGGTKIAFVNEAMYQHHYSYPNVLDVPQILNGITGSVVV